MNPALEVKLEVYAIFPQIWGSTSLGFDVTPDGSPTIGGSAMTEAFTTIFHEINSDTYVVCFGNRSCYSVDNANDAFFEDIKNRNLASLSVAKNKY